MGKVKILTERCKGCKLCIPVCPKELLTLSDDVNSSGCQVVKFNSRGECSACAQCALVCPDIALEIYR